jgi:hypothetical protein
MNDLKKLMEQAEDKVAEELRDTGLRLGLIAATLLTGNGDPSDEDIKRACLAAAKIFATSAQTAVQLADVEV